jgi:hypothetical protein
MTWTLFSLKAAPCDGALIQRGGRLTRLSNMGLGAAAGRRSVLASPAAHVAAFGRLRKAAVSAAGCRDDPRCGAEFRCIAAKAPDYISFHDNDAASEAVAAAAYLMRCSEQRGRNAKWRISNILDDRRIHSWTASRCRVTISRNSSQ